MSEFEQDKQTLARTCVGNDVITALLHYSQAPHLVPLFQWLADIADQRFKLESNTSHEVIQLSEITNWLISFVGTRKGKRVDENSKAKLFGLLEKAVDLLLGEQLGKCGDEILSDQARNNLIQFVALSLPLGRIQDLIGPGKKIVDRIASLGSNGRISLSFTALATSLGQSAFEFTGFRQIVLPAVMNLTVQVFNGGEDVEAKSQALSLLATLQKQGQFQHLTTSTPTSTSTAWIKAVSAEVEKRLLPWSDQIKGAFTGDESVLACLSLSTLLHSNAKQLVEILCQCVCNLAIVRTNCKFEFEKTPFNHAGFLGETLQSLVSLLDTSDVQLFKYSQKALSDNMQAQRIAINFAWHRGAICSYSRLASTLHRKGFSLHMPKLDELFSTLKTSLISSDEPLRLSAARLLSMAEEKEKEKNESLLWRLVEIEETPLQVETVRERNVRMRAVAREIIRLKQIGKDTNLLDKSASITISYLVSVFKLNFRPLWEENSKALVDLSAVYGQLVWDSAFDELTMAKGIMLLPAAWSDSRLEEQTLEDSLDDDGIDKQFRDPILSERKKVIRDSLQSHGSISIVQAYIAHQRPGGRLDVINYQSLVLKLFGSLSTLAERNNAPLMKHFFDTIASRGDAVEDDEEVDQAEEILTETGSSKKLTMMQRRAQLCAYLETFAQFSNPKALFRSDDFHHYLYTLCSLGDNKIQSLALDVILRWKDSAQITYSALLKKLTDPNTFREELTKLNLGAEGDTIQKAHRKNLLPLLIRLFFGIMVSKRGRASQGSGQAGRKNAILLAMSELSATELKPLVEVMLEPFPDQQSSATDGFVFASSPANASHGQQAGFLSLLGDVIKHLGLRLIPLWNDLIEVTLNLTFHASRRAEVGQGKTTQIDRSIRQSGLRRIDDFFKQPTSDFDWTLFMIPIFEQLISPRLGSLRSESVQSPSALLDLIHSWSNSSHTVFYLGDYDNSLLEHVYACLKMPSVKPIVIARVLDIVEAILSYVDAKDKNVDIASNVEARLLRPNTSVFLSGLTPLVHRCNATTGIEAKAMKKDDLLRRLLNILKGLSPYISTETDASALLDALSPILRKSNAIIAEKSKVDLLLVYERLLSLVPQMKDPQSEAFAAQYKLFSSLLSRLRSRNARAALCKAFTNFSLFDKSLERVNGWIQDLNSFDVKKMEEYDFERRFSVFDRVNDDSLDPPLFLREWLPLIHNFLFNLQEIDELAIRSNASSSIRNFIDVVTLKKTDQKEFPTLFNDVVYPGLRRSVRNKSDLVQREAISILGYAVSRLGNSISYLGEMKQLLVDGDEEANFFNNIFHIQIHRRIRALNRLGQEAEKGSFSSRLIAEIFLPLVDEFLNTDSHHGDANVIQAAVECLGKLSMHLKWGPYNVLLWKFLSIGKKSKDGEKEKDKSDKVCVRAAMSILDRFHFQMEEVVTVNVGDPAGEAVEEDADEELIEAQAQESKKVLSAVQNRLLPKLMDFLDQKDDLEDTVRLPIAVGVARVMLKLPNPLRRLEITKLLNTLANVFKSKAQDTRDLARVTLGKVAISLGPDYLPAIVKELRRALVRGPQKAVLAYTVHNVLIQCMSNQEQPLTILNTGTNSIAEIVMEDIFGQTSEDRDSIENRTTYKEVKNTKSLDTLEQVAKIVGSTHVSSLLIPVRDLMHQTEAVKAVRSMDDYLKRVALGLNVNIHLASSDFLLLCHSLLTSNADFLQASAQNGKQKKGSRSSAVLRKRAEVEGDVGRDHYARNAYKFVAFGLDLLINGLRKNRFDWSDTEILGKLDPMIGAVGNCLYAKQASVIVAGLRALTMLVKCPLPSVQTSLPLVIKQTLKIVEKEGTNAQSDILIASLKLLTVVIRDISSSTLQDRQVTQLCQLIDMNLEEDAELQGVLFGLLRAIVSRKFVLVEVYDVMDKVASMMVTNQSNSIRDTCRSTYLTFLLEFPQGQDRFSNQMKFLATNIGYVFESGRLSLLEFLRVIFIKMNEETLRDYLNLYFVSLVMCLGNDESSKCKEKAAKLIVQILNFSRQEEREKLINMVHLWAQSVQGDKRDLSRVAMIIYGLLTEISSLQENEEWKGKALSNARKVLAISAEELAENEVLDDENEDLSQDWQMPYHALQVVSKLYMGKTIELDNDGETWKVIRDLLLFPHTWVRSTACRLLGQKLGQMDIQRPKGSDGQFASMSNLLRLTKKMSLMLKSSHLDEILALQIVKNFLFVGKCFALVPVGTLNSNSQDDDGSEEEEAEEDEEREHDWLVENPLRWMFTKLSHQLRQSRLSSASVEPISLLQPSSLLKWFAAMMNHLPVEQCRLFLTHVISPLYRLLEAESHLARNDENFVSLQSLASEVQDLVQQKVGTNTYAATYSTIKQKMADKRKKRKNDAMMLAIEDPEKAMRRKASINKRKHDSRKRKTQSYANNKERIRPIKRQK